MIIQENVLLAEYTTFGVGGPARFFVVVRTTEELVEALTYASENNLPVHILGGGSNVLIADNGWNGLVVHMQITTCEYDDGFVYVGAGHDWDAFVADTLARGYAGLEQLSGIPGTVGGAVVQNIGAYGVECADVCESVRVYDRTEGVSKTMSSGECHFAYRTSSFKEESDRYVIVGVTFKLSQSSVSHGRYGSLPKTASPSEMRKAVLAARRGRGMLQGQHRSAGSFFKNCIVTSGDLVVLKDKVDELKPDRAESLGNWYWEMDNGMYKVATAFLMEMTVFNKTDFTTVADRYGASISPDHTLSLVAGKDTKACDIHALAEAIQKEIHTVFGVQVAPEVTYVTQ